MAYENFIVYMKAMAPLAFILGGILLSTVVVKQFKFLLFITDQPASKKVEKPNYRYVNILLEKDNMITFSFVIKSFEKQPSYKRWISSTIKIGKNVYKKGYTEYQFTTHRYIFNKISSQIHKPLSEIKEETILIQFNEAIHYSLKQLEQFSKNRESIDLQAEVDKVIGLVKEIKGFADYIDKEAQGETEKFKIDSMNKVIEKHHIVMDQLTNGVKIFNSYNNTTVSLEKKKLDDKSNHINE